MNKVFIMNLFVFIFVALINFIIYSCKEYTTSTNSDANTISGTVTFVDTIFANSSIGAYMVAAFVSWPPFSPPVASDTLKYFRDGNLYKANFKLKKLNNGPYGEGRYVVACGWRTTAGWRSPTLGIYGCDTSNSCAMTIQPNVNLPVNEGVNNINFKVYSDTTKKLFLY